MSPPATSIATSLLGPLFTLTLWTLIMEVVMYTYRLPVFLRLNIASKPDLTSEQINKLIPPHIRYKADNFNHLMEQPMNFYVVVLAMAQMHSWKREVATDAAGGYRVDLALAWAYVVLRVAHSYMQCVGNQVEKRFFIFITSSGVLALLAMRGAWMVAEVLA